MSPKPENSKAKMFDKVHVLDGGLASTLQMMGHDIDGDPLWSAKCLHSNPTSICNAHLAFLNAGADIIITASYQASIEGFKNHLGLSKEDSVKLIEKSVLLAKESRDIFKTHNEKEILIAGSVGSYGACLADGSEYSGSYVDQITEQELRDWHKPRIEILVSSGVDLLACETIPSLKEALVLLRLIKDYPATKAWISFACKDESCTNYGDEIGEAFKMCFSENPEQLVAIGINCTNPLYITSLLKKADQSVPGSLLTRVVYPNSGEIWTNEKRWEGDPTELMNITNVEIKNWLSLGTKIIGGCCRVSPSHIEKMSNLIKTVITD